MAKTVLLNPSIVINSVNLSAWCDSVTIEETYADVDDTGFGAGSKTRIAGLGDHKFTLEVQQDFATSGPEATLYPLLGTVVSIAVLPLVGTTSTTNPSYSFSALITQWMPLAGKIGDLEKASVTWPISGAVVKAFS
jgi:hypothetical protein